MLSHAEAYIFILMFQLRVDYELQQRDRTARSANAGMKNKSERADRGSLRRDALSEAKMYPTCQGTDVHACRANSRTHAHTLTPIYAHINETYIFTWKINNKCS